MSTDKTGMSPDNTGTPHADPHGEALSEPTIAQLNAAATAEAAAEAFNLPHTGAKHHDDLIADLRREASDLKDKYLRAHADMDNLRKRTEREKEDAAKYANTRFARDLLTIGDTFQRALASVPSILCSKAWLMACR
jgi:molecular chaperone GrpE